MDYIDLNMDDPNEDLGIFNDNEYSDEYSEILFGTALEWDEALETAEHVIGIQWINDARIKRVEELKSKVDINLQTKRIEKIHFTMPNDNDKLSSVFDGIPYGIVKKNRTGVGATTLELSSNRNSIVVVPTRALAYGKAAGSKIDEMNKYRVLYVGGHITGFNPPSIEEYLNDDEITPKKFIVVIDSLKRLIETIGYDTLNDYFIMFDEVDSLQDSSHYRDNIEKNFDYYFKFDHKRRCIVSATIGSFSNPALKNESTIEVEFNNPAPRNIILRPTRTPIPLTRDEVLRIHSENPNDKIVIALNLLSDGILHIIESLPDDVKNLCSILCSDTNKDNAQPYYTECENDMLSSQITFMTSNYFVGVDINEPFHLICSQWTRHSFTLLSTEKLQQIAGRCRIPNGILSETIIYNWNENTADIDLLKLEQSLVHKAYQLSNLDKILNEVRPNFPLLFNGVFGINRNNILDAAKQRYEYSDKISIIRLDNEGNIVPSFFNIDNILIQNKLRTSLYKYPEILKEKLIQEGNNITYIIDTSDGVEPISDNIIDCVSAHVTSTIENQREEVINRLRETDEANRKRVARDLRINVMESVKRFIKHFIELCDYIEFEYLVDLLKRYDTHREYTPFKNAVLIWCLDDSHGIKTTIENNFSIGSFMTGEELLEAYNSIYHGILGMNPITSVTKVHHKIKPIVKLSPRTSTTRNGVQVNGYRVVSLNPYNFQGEPKQIIPSTQNMVRLLKL